MRNWLALNGEFTEEEDGIVFHGGYLDNQPDLTDDSKTLGKFGILLFEDNMSNGEIEATVEFCELSKNDEAEIVFNYQNETSFMCAGIANYPAKYEFKEFNNQWNYIKLSGFNSSLVDNTYKLNVKIIGSMVQLYVNGIKVLSAMSLTPIRITNVGLWVRSKNSIKISGFKAHYQQTVAFTVSQFGGNYDILYNDVIKPICEQMGLKSIRGDEVATNSLIIEDIISLIRSSDVIIVDISPDNPNVFYELGYAHAICKPTILLCEKTCREKLPFDVSGFRTIFYDDSIGGKKYIEHHLKEHLNALGVATMK